MNNYYAFVVNEYFANFYNEKPSVLYKIFEQIYQLNKDDLILGYRIFEQVATPFNKKDLSQHFYDNYCSELSYARKEHKHYYNNLYIGEDTKVIVYNSHLKIRSNIDYPTLMHSLKEFNSSIFICEFEKKEFFWLNKINEMGIVKS